MRIVILCISIILFGIGCKKDANTTTRKAGNPPGSTIIYTDVNPDSVILKLSADTFNLDVNNDGVNDFLFLRSYTEDQCSDDLLGSFAWDNNLSVKPATISNTIMTNASNFPPALDSSALISQDSVWTNTSGVLLYGATNVSGHCITTLPKIQGYWLSVSDKYLGLKFIKGNNTYYGWVRLTSTYYVSPQNQHVLIPGNFIIKDYAYNSIPNQKILAGQTK